MSSLFSILCIVALSLVVGFWLGVYYTLGKNDEEMKSAKASIKFWQDIAKRQSQALTRDPLLPVPPDIEEPESNPVNKMKWK